MFKIPRIERWHSTEFGALHRICRKGGNVRGRLYTLCRYIIFYSGSVQILAQKVSSGQNRKKTVRGGTFSKERERNKRD